MQGDDDNPYRRPASAVAEIPAVTAMVDAGKWRRFFNWLLDYVAILLIAIVVALCAVLVGGDAVMSKVYGLNAWEEILLRIVVMMAYYILMEGLFGLTVGKWITGTRVVDEAGGRPSWRQALLRALARLIPFEPFSVLLSEDGATRGWHDSLPRTRVVMRNSLQESPSRVVM